MSEIHPKNSTFLFGHDDAELQLHGDAKAGRLPHGLIISGIRGIGKATLAYRLARILLTQEGVNPEAVFSRIAAGSHTDLLVLEPEFDEKKGEYAKDINVDQAREVAKFLSLTAAESNWRVVIIDSADALNTNAANAILKILEEPPPQAILLLISHQPSLLLPTIRSRCQVIKLRPLKHEAFVEAAKYLLPDAGGGKLSAFAQLTGGAPGKALEYEEQGALAMYDEILALVESLPVLDSAALHAFADKALVEKPHEKWRLFADLALFLFERIAKQAADIGLEGVTSREVEVLEHLAKLYPPHVWANKWQQSADNFLLAQRLHLDYKQVIITFFHSISSEEGLRLGSAAA
ncbi:MAG: DNA polymerase III subunit delta' [Alphaproteobacteria bacterium]